MNEKYCKVPNQLIWKTNSDNDCSIVAKYNQQELILLHSQLMLLRNMWHEVRFSISHLCSMMNMSKRTENYEIIKKCLSIFQEENYLKGEKVDFNDYKTNDQITLLYQPFKIENDKEVSYFSIKYSTIEKLMSLSKTKRDDYHALNLYSYFSSRLYRNPEGKSYQVTGKYEVCFPTFEEIRKDTKQGNKTIISIMKLLSDNKFIYYKNAGYYNDEGKIRQARNTITLTEQENYKEQVKYSIRYYKENKSINFMKRKQ